jgi:1,4-dihydroxy-2-naphthoyl-CoA hydrolase
MSVDREQLIGFIHERHPQTVLGKLGISVTEFGAEKSVVEVPVSSDLFQHAGLVHGGIYVLLMESAASIAAALSVDIAKNRVAGQEISASHVRAVTSGHLRAVATRIHAGKTSMVFACEVLDEHNRLVSTGRCTIAVRPNA